MSPIEIGASRPVGPVQVSTPKTTRAGSAAPATEALTPVESGAAAQVEKSSALDAGQAAPVDAERVKVIRHAIETGTYPVVPAKIADAMIAAGMLLRTAQ
ncbi:flagellar biosynthesis anti-sigma factor FlgM [Novosphingobium jiangmenense]|uniref:Negative regulator of flagellin synthesis n=1 Tax=Novosphingobium jiangmenense TaxID=2791981 RepID=A0ABS0HIK9_9SPHN|nr:flagellar biosynthesis anti-sigma factor FlgM [Novosphingobium jiangmenense]MBF9151978.1 flagellar biosynthesis anti-sigma factor FlgM [Novosphingobium jiangmenense]